MATLGGTMDQRYAAALRCSPDAMLVTDGDGRIIDMNVASEVLSGWALAEARGHELSEVLNVVDEDSRAPLVFEASNESVAHLPDGAALVRRDGTQLALSGSSTALVDDDGVPVGILIVLRDVSERRRLLSRLLVADRMGSVGMLAASIGHEINNPLSYVMANIDFAVQELEASGTPVPEPITEALGEARIGADRAGRIVKQLRSWSRAEKERPQVLDLRPVLERAAAMAWAEIRHRARFTKEYRLAPPVLADETRLSQVFIILLVNAAQAIPEGRSDVNEIRVVTTHDASGAAVIEVRDTGKGIAREDLERIFEPFFTTKPAGEGTGLGLSIVQSIVSSLGGRIEVESAPGAGTVFRVILPPAIAEGSRETVIVESKTSVPATRRQLGLPRVLIVDDEPLICGAVRRALEGEYQVTAFTSGRAALDHLVAGQRYDALLVDVMMPEMSGIDLYAELRLVAPEHVARVVFLSGGAFTPRAIQFLRDGRHRRLEKPFDTRTLQAVLAEIVS